MRISEERLNEITFENTVPMEDIEALLDDAESALAKPEPDVYIRWLEVAIGKVQNVSDEALVDRILGLLHRYKRRISNEKSMMSCDYAYMNLYLRMRFVPKEAEYALKVIDNPSDYAVFKYSAYNELAIITNSCGMHEEAMEYMKKASEYISRTDVLSPTSFDLVTENNYCDFLASAGEIEEMEVHKQKVVKLLEENQEDSIVKMMSWSIRMDLISSDFKAYGVNEEIIKRFMDMLHQVEQGKERLNCIYHSVDTDAVLLQKMYEMGYVKECIQSCKIFVLNKDSFSGDISEIYRVLFMAYRDMPGALKPNEHMRFMTEYVDYLENDKQNTRSMLKHLVREQFRIRKIDSKYDDLKIRYETDSLTGGYSRPGFDTSAAGFAKANPEGSLIFIDIDNMKITNDKLGHEAGDFLLKQFSELSRQVLDNRQANLYRYAGDEFIILTAGGQAEAQGIIEDMYRNAKQPFSYGNQKIFIEFSYGIVTFAEAKKAKADEGLKEDLVAVATKIGDARMYENKRTHKEKANILQESK